MGLIANVKHIAHSLKHKTVIDAFTHYLLFSSKDMVITKPPITLLIATITAVIGLHPHCFNINHDLMRWEIILASRYLISMTYVGIPSDFS